MLEVEPFEASSPLAPKRAAKPGNNSESEGRGLLLASFASGFRFFLFSSVSNNNNTCTETFTSNIIGGFKFLEHIMLYNSSSSSIIII